MAVELFLLVLPDLPGMDGCHVYGHMWMDASELKKYNICVRYYLYLDI
jgi:hypothetical protein